MSKIDQYESVFKSAERDPFAYHKVRFDNCLTVTDLARDEAEQLAAKIQAFIQHTTHEDSNWQCLTSDDLQSVSGFVRRLEQEQPDLICTYRNLMTPAPDYPYSLGVFLDVMTQATTIPVLVIPSPHTGKPLELQDMVNTVMAITDHLVGDHNLVNMAAALTPDDGALWLTHVEDEKTFNRFMAAISKIPEIDTDEARQLIKTQLLKDPTNYMESCRRGLSEAGQTFAIQSFATMGHRLFDYKSIIREHAVDLVVLHTKDEDQLAMHGLAYPLTVELRNTPLLLV